MINAIVEVPEPQKGDMWSHSFIGTIVDLIDNDTIAIVSDHDEACWTVDVNRLKVLAEDVT